MKYKTIYRFINDNTKQVPGVQYPLWSEVSFSEAHVNLICILPGLSPFQCCVNKKKPVFRFCWKNSFGPNVYGVRHECCTGSCQIMSCTLYGVRHEWCVLNSKQNEGNYDFNKHESQTWGIENYRLLQESTGI